MLKTIFIFLILLMFSISVMALPNYSVKNKRNAQNLAEVQIINKTVRSLVCYVAIDGQKIFFLLKSYEQSKWYKATHPGFNYSHFSTWCDYLYMHPEYAPKKN